jgi:hypothetical protein
MDTLAIGAELWRDIPGYEGAYQVSILGNVRSLTREITQKGRWGKYFTRILKGKNLRPGQYNKSGHVSVVLGRGTNGMQVHKLVMITFVGERPANADIRHLDGNPKNNRLDNLAYGTRTENILDVFEQGKAWRNTTKAQAQKVKGLLKEGHACKFISKNTGVSLHAVYHIKNGSEFGWLTS